MFRRAYRYQLLISFLFLFNLVGKESEKLILVTSLYNETVIERQEEYLNCLKENKDHPKIEKICIFYDRSKDDLNETSFLEKLNEYSEEIIFIDKRPTFHEIFDFVNESYPNRVVVIANADIYFDSTLNCLDYLNLNNTFLGLTRWNVDNTGNLESHPHYNTQGMPAYFSQDTWIFKTPIRNFDELNIELGTYHCDGYIAYLAYKNGLKIANPCLSIKSHHLHNSNLRHWTKTARVNYSLRLHWCSIRPLFYPSKYDVVLPDRVREENENAI
jgi:hypothetical protein